MAAMNLNASPEGRPDPAADAPASTQRGRPCLNCGTPAPGNFCPQCGQETATAVLPFGVWLRGLIGAVSDRRGRLRLTLSRLLLAPGALTVEYRAGRKARYLRPLQVYLTASVIVFAAVQFLGLGLALRFAGDEGVYFLRNSPPAPNVERGQRLTAMQFIIDHVDTPAVRRFEALSVQQRFAFMRARRAVSVSYFIFFLVPIFALTVGLFHRDRRRPFGEHLVFALHCQAFLLVALLVEALLPAVAANALSLWVLAYFALALKRVYGHSWPATLGRGLLVLAAYAGIFLVANLLLLLGLIAF
jgi:hypothetical protein